MSGQDFILAPCVPEDIEQLVDVYDNAFKNNYLSSFTFPASSIKEKEKRRWLRQRFLRFMSRPEIRHFKVTEVSTGRIAAWARWYFPYTFSEEEKAERQRESEISKVEIWPLGSNIELCQAKFGSLDEFKKANVNFEDMYVTDLLMTDPAFQRKGLGKMLLKHGLGLADAEGRKTYIEATPEGKAVYEKLGFEEIDVLIVDLSKWGGTEPGVNTIMLRDPQPL